MISPGWRALTFVFTTMISFAITFVMTVILMLGVAPYAPESIFYLVPTIIAAICAAVWAWLIIPFILRGRLSKNASESR